MSCAGIVDEGSPWCPRQSFGLISLCLVESLLMSFMKRPCELALDPCGAGNLSNCF